MVRRRKLSTHRFPHDIGNPINLKDLNVGLARRLILDGIHERIVEGVDSVVKGGHRTRDK